MSHQHAATAADQTAPARRVATLRRYADLFAIAGILVMLSAMIGSFIRGAEVPLMVPVTLAGAVAASGLAFRRLSR